MTEPRRDPFDTAIDDLARVTANCPTIRRRSKATYDLPEDIVQAVHQISDAESIARSDVVAWALSLLITDYRHGSIDWTNCRTPSRSPRTAWKLEIPPIPADP